MSRVRMYRLTPIRYNMPNKVLVCEWPNITLQTAIDCLRGQAGLEVDTRPDAEHCVTGHKLQADGTILYFAVVRGELSREICRLELEFDSTLRLEVGDRCRLKFAFPVGGMESDIPSGSEGTYKGVSDCVEKYHLFDMDEDHGQLDSTYGCKHCLCVDQEDLDMWEKTDHLS